MNRGTARSRSVLLVTVGLVAALSGCAVSSGDGARTASTADASKAAPATATATATPSARPTTTAASEDRVSSFCAANTAAAAAVTGTVAEDITARQEQADATRALLPVPGASPQVAAGAEKFLAAAEETVAILRSFPPESKVADVGTDPRFLQSSALRDAASDADYRTFLGWVIETCSSTR